MVNTYPCQKLGSNSAQALTMSFELVANCQLRAGQLQMLDQGVQHDVLLGVIL